MAYEVKLEVFEGPIDLLLHLITRQRVDIYEVSISTITEEYLEARGRRSKTSISSPPPASSWWPPLCSSSNPPGCCRAQSLDDADGSLLEERDLLLARLVELSTFREAGAWIAVGLEQGAGFHRPVRAGLEPQFVGLAPDLLARVDPGRPGARPRHWCWRRSPSPARHSHVAPITASVKDAISDISTRPPAGGRGGVRATCARPPATGSRSSSASWPCSSCSRRARSSSRRTTGSARSGPSGPNEVAAEEVVEEAEEYTSTCEDEAV